MNTVTVIGSINMDTTPSFNQHAQARRNDACA